MGLGVRVLGGGGSGSGSTTGSANVHSVTELSPLSPVASTFTTSPLLHTLPLQPLPLHQPIAGIPITNNNNNNIVSPNSPKNPNMHFPNSFPLASNFNNVT